MITRLGVSIHRRELRAVLVRRGRIAWHCAIATSQSDGVAESIDTLLASMPKIGVGPRWASIAVGLSWCQVKQIDGLPAVKDGAMVTRLVRENSASFFLRGASALAVSEVVRHADGVIWAAAFDHAVVSEALEALRKRGFTKARVLPSVAALASLLPAGVHRWEDADVVIEMITADDRSIRRLRRVTDGAPVVLVAFGGALAPLDDGSWATAAAFGAAVARPHASFIWRPEPNPKRAARVMRLRVGIAAAVALGAGIGALAAPGVHASRVVRESSRELARLRKSQTDMARAQGELKRAAATLDRVERFREQRGRTTMLLGALSQALPESTALVSFRLDSLEGSFVALTPHAADILQQLVSVAELSAPRIVGSLTRETVGGAQLERSTIRFKRPRAAPGGGR